MSADWQLIERFRDMEIFFDTASIRSDENSVSVTTLVNYFQVRNRGDGEFQSKITFHAVYCTEEKLISKFSADYREHFAKGGVVSQSKLSGPIVDAKPMTVAGKIHEAVCQLRT